MTAFENAKTKDDEEKMGPLAMIGEPFWNVVTWTAPVVPDARYPLSWERTTADPELRPSALNETVTLPEESAFAVIPRFIPP